MTRVSVKPDYDYGSPGVFDVDVEVGLTTGPHGWLFLSVRNWGRLNAAHYSPARARQLAFTLMDLADLAELELGTYNPNLDPFETELVAQAATAEPSL